MSLVKSTKRRFPWMMDNLAESWKMNDFFNDDFFTNREQLPAMNVKEREDDFKIEFAVPGFNKEDFEISIENDLLYISAEKSLEDIEDEDGYTRKEFSYSNFHRTLQLPKSIDTTQEINASYKNGVLSLKLMKDQKKLNAQRKYVEIH